MILNVIVGGLVALVSFAVGYILASRHSSCGDSGGGESLGTGGDKGGNDMSMVQFSADKTSLKVEVATDVPVQGQPGRVWTVICKYPCGSEVEATVLLRHLKERFDAAVRGAKQYAYNAGYRDGRAKQGKQTWFSSCLGGC